MRNGKKVPTFFVAKQIDKIIESCPGNCRQTHEPCSMCLSAITWAGFDNFIYLFSYQESRDLFAIPHDLNILNQVFNVQDGNYKKSNQYWTSYSIDEILNSGDFKNLKNLKQRVTNIKRSYDELSELYQQTKANNNIPLN